MVVSEILSGKGAGVITATSDQAVWAVLRKFRTHGIGAVVVTDADGHLLGLFTERDVVNGLLAQGKRLLDKPVREVMSTAVHTCAPDDSVAHVMQVMTERRTRHLPVLEDGELVGIISIGDLVKLRNDELEYENRILRDITRART